MSFDVSGALMCGGNKAKEKKSNCSALLHSNHALSLTILQLLGQEFLPNGNRATNVTHTTTLCM